MIERESLNFLLQQTNPKAVHEVCMTVERSAVVTILQEPTVQTLLLPVADPVNRSSFYAGEVLVTSAIVQVGNSKGWAMVMDENTTLARAVAILDGAFAEGLHRPAIIALIKDGRRRHEEKSADLAGRVEATRVSFDLM